MSVINQMLKDLEQRAPEQGQASLPTVAPKRMSTVKIVLISLVVLLSLNALGFYIWNLQERVEKSESKQQNVERNSFRQLNEVAQQEVANTDNVEQNSFQQLNEVAQQEVANTANVERNSFRQSNEAAQQEVANTGNVERNSFQQLNEAAQEGVANTGNVERNSFRQSNEAAQQEVANTANVERNLFRQLNETTQEDVANTDNVGRNSFRQSNKPSQMSVSRRQLTSKELVAQKLVRAEKSINLNALAKAEQLFEDILIIEPAHKQARKKLAALWFGRKSYQQAVNLLSQGIAIDRQDDELRTMKAQIHLKQGQHEAAYNTLKPLASFEQEEYQVMFANISQQIEQYSSAIGAYQVLIKMQPYSGRWHLGLAIVYDKNSQFSLAVNEYELALTKADLSASSANFATQRMQALGE